MKEILKRMEERENERENMTWSQQLQHFKELRNQFEILAPNPLTPAMEEVIAMRQKRISVEIDVPITPEPSDSEDDCSSHEEYRPRFVVKKKISPNKKVDLINSPFEFRDDDDEVDNIGRFRSCINVVNTSVESLTNTTTTVTSTANTSLKVNLKFFRVQKVSMLKMLPKCRQNSVKFQSKFSQNLAKIQPKFNQFLECLETEKFLKRMHNNFTIFTEHIIVTTKNFHSE